MIYSYEIKNANNEDVLYLYLDFNTEFAKIGKQKKTFINEEINDYLKKENIKFDGKKVVLMAGGLIIGTCLFTSPLLNSKEEANLNYNYSTNVLVLEENNYLDLESLTNESIKDAILENNVSTNIDTNKSVADNVSTSIKKNTNKDVFNEQKDKTTKVSTNDNSSNTVHSTNKITTSKEAKLMVTIKRRNGTILYMELEEYLIGVVGAEMPASFSIEALKAQAVAARTYTLKSIQDNVVLTDTVATQVYKDNNELKSMWGSGYTAYYKKVKQAVNSTKGLVMYYNDTLINAFYHSTSNGYTEDSTQVFGSYPYLKSVVSSVDVNVSSYLRTVDFSYEEISNILDIPVTSLSSIAIHRNSTNRVSSIIIDNNTYDGVKFRTILGLRSTDFDISLNEDNVAITTRGYGHGVGMSQYGANEYAKKGWNYSKILKHYYTGVTIKSY